MRQPPFPHLSTVTCISLYLLYAGPQHPWAVAVTLHEFGRPTSPEQVEEIISEYPKSFARGSDWNGPLVGLRTRQWEEEMETSGHAVRRFQRKAS